MQNENIKIKIPEILKVLFYGEKEKIAKICQEIYSQRKSPNSPGGFRYYKERKINRPTLSTNS